MKHLHTIYAALLLSLAASSLRALPAEDLDVNDDASLVAADDTSPAPNPTDACGWLLEKPSWKYAHDCLNQFPYSPAIHAQVENVVTKLIDTYVFADTAKNSPDKLFQPDYDIQAALKKVFAKKDYANDMAFQEAVASAFVPLNDAHTSYVPNCYRQLLYAQPFYPVAQVGKDGKTRIFIQAVGEDFSDYENLLGGEILSIEGVPSVKYLWDWTYKDNIGINKDAMSRFNRAMARLAFVNDKWQPFPGEFSSRTKLPEKETVKYEVLPPASKESVVITVPWKVIPYFASFTDAKSYWESNCLLNIEPEEEDNDDGDEEPAESLIGPRTRHHRALVPNERAILESLPASVMGIETKGNVTSTISSKKPGILQLVKDGERFMQKALFSDSGAAFYTLQSDEQVGVLVIKTFSPSYPSKMKQVIADAFAYMNEKGTKKLLIDVSANSGGSSCLASELVAVITPHLWKSFPVVQNQYLKDERLSPLLMKLHQTALKKNRTEWNPRRWISGATGKNFIGEEFFNSTRVRPLNKNGKEKDPFPYSPLLRDDCMVSAENPLRNITHNFKPHQDIAIFSDGLCGSACGRFHFHLSELNSVKSVVTGSFNKRKRSASGYSATQVMSYDEFVGDIRELGLSKDPLAFDMIPLRVDFQISIRETFSRIKRNTPLEFLFLEADLNLDWDSWSAFRPDRAWEQAAVELGWVPSWNKKVKLPESPQ